MIESSLTKHISRIENLRDLVLYRFGSTGVHQVLTRAAELLGLTPVFPVRNIATFSSGDGREGGVFRDCVLVKKYDFLRNDIKAHSLTACQKFYGRRCVSQDHGRCAIGVCGNSGRTESRRRRPCIGWQERHLVIQGWKRLEEHLAFDMLLASSTFKPSDAMNSAKTLHVKASVTSAQTRPRPRPTALRSVYLTTATANMTFTTL